MEKKRTMTNECWICEHMENIPGDCHISCNKPDPAMRGVPHGIQNGWFFYPLNFDPVWKARFCNNFKIGESK